MQRCRGIYLRPSLRRQVEQAEIGAGVLLGSRFHANARVL